MLASTAFLHRYEAGKNTFQGFCPRKGLEQLTPDQQRTALLCKLDGAVRAIRFGLGIDVNASMTDVICAVQAYLRRQLNVLIDLREVNTSVQQPGESSDEL